MVYLLHSSCVDYRLKTLYAYWLLFLLLSRYFCFFIFPLLLYDEQSIMLTMSTLLTINICGETVSAGASSTDSYCD